MSHGAAPLLLDTHVWIWLAAGERLGREHVGMVDQAASNGRLRVAAVPVWEVALLAARGRGRLGADVGAWVEGSLALPGLSLVSLTPPRACSTPI